MSTRLDHSLADESLSKEPPKCGKLENAPNQRGQNKNLEKPGSNANLLHF